jgi:hypothetical protein
MDKEKKVSYPYKIGDRVMYPSDNCPFIVTGVRFNEVRIYGDFSGGTHAIRQEDWVHINDVKPAQLTPSSREEEQIEIWRELIDDYDVTDKSSYGYGALIDKLSAKFTINRKQ